MIRYQVGHGQVILMAEPRHNGDRKGRQITAEIFVIEDSQIFAAAAAAGQHQGVQSQRARFLGQTTQHLSDSRCHAALNRDRHHQQACHRPPFGGGTKHVRQGGAGSAGQNRQCSWLPRKRSAACDIEQPRLLQPATHQLELPQHGAQARADVQHLDVETGSCSPEIQLADHGHPVAVFRPITELPQLGCPRHCRDACLPIGEGQPEVAFFELGPGDGRFNQEARSKAPFQQVADGGVEFRDGKAGDPVSAQDVGRRNPSRGKPRR